jgi:hypothetical protein
MKEIGIKLIDELGIDKAALYLKYKHFKVATDKTTPPQFLKLDTPLAVSLIFDIDIHNKEALYFIIIGLWLIENEIESIIETSSPGGITQ